MPPSKNLAKLPDTDLQTLLLRYQRAANARAPWVSLWQDCYDYTLPSYSARSTPDRRSEKLYDGTASDAVDQLAATLLNHLIPVQANWFTLQAGADLDREDAANIAAQLARYERLVARHFTRSNLSVALHQCLLDLIVGGTACLLCEEAMVGAPSALQFTAIPLFDAVLADSGSGYLDTLYRRVQMPLAQAMTRYKQAQFPPQLQRKATDMAAVVDILEAVEPRPQGGVTVSAILLEGAGHAPQMLQSRILGQSPVIAMRWMKAPSEDYGRSPVMKALPDIKTANKVVELILQNASIAVAGIWQADDDGVLNIANLSLKPGTIIPKAVGSKGLTPLEMPGKFDISQLVLDDLRSRIRHALLVDRLPQAQSRTMTATEVVARTAEMAVLLSGVYSRLQNELLYPLLLRAMQVLVRRGVLPDLPLGGDMIDIVIASPLVKAANQQEVQTMQDWLGLVSSLGTTASDSLNVPDIVAAISRSMGVPAAFYTPALPIPEIISDLISQPLSPETGAITHVE